MTRPPRPPSKTTANRFGGVIGGLHWMLSRLGWKIHLLKDWWGTKVWTKTSEVVTPLGFKLTSGYHPAYSQMRDGTFETEETKILSEYLPRVDHFIDVGANLGYYTLLALKLGTPVIAFEPQRQNLRCLTENLSSNNWTAEVHPIALSDRPGEMTLYGASGPSASLISNWANYSSYFRQTVGVSTLDTVLGNRFANEKLLIKIDVEGAEYSVLKGAEHTISRFPRPSWLIEICLNEFHPEGVNPKFRETFALFWRHGYRAFTATAERHEVTPAMVDQWIQNKRSTYGTFNYLFISEQ